MDKYQEMLLELENQKEQIEKAKEQIKNARRLTQRMTPKCENCHHFVQHYGIQHGQTARKTRNNCVSKNPFWSLYFSEIEKQKTR